MAEHLNCVCDNTSPFILNSGQEGIGTTLSFVSCQHSPSLSSTLLPLTQLSVSPFSRIIHSFPSDTPAVDTISAHDLDSINSHLITNCGPLFDLNDPKPFSPSLIHTLSTVLSSSHFFNTSGVKTTPSITTTFTPSQRIVSSDIAASTNHLSGTTCLDPNFGGDFLCLNTSFSHCQTTSNADPTIRNTSLVHRRQQSKFDFHVNTTIFVYLFIQSTFRSIASRNPGGALIFSGFRGGVNISACTFQECSSKTTGGALIFDLQMEKDLPPVLINSSVFIDCNASESGGCIYAAALMQLYIYNSTFIRGSVFGNPDSLGGGIHLVTVRETNIFSTLFMQCQSMGWGGAISIENETYILLDSVQFRNNEALWFGSDLYFNKSYELSLDDKILNCDTTTTQPSVYLEKSGDQDDLLSITQHQAALIEIENSTYLNDERHVVELRFKADVPLDGVMMVIVDNTGDYIPPNWFYYKTYNSPNPTARVLFLTFNESEFSNVLVFPCGEDEILQFESTYTVLEASMLNTDMDVLSQLSFITPNPSRIVAASYITDLTTQTRQLVFKAKYIALGDYTVVLRLGQDRYTFNTTFDGTVEEGTSNLVSSGTYVFLGGPSAVLKPFTVFLVESVSHVDSPDVPVLHDRQRIYLQTPTLPRVTSLKVEEFTNLHEFKLQLDGSYFVYGDRWEATTTTGITINGSFKDFSNGSSDLYTTDVEGSPFKSNTNYTLAQIRLIDGDYAILEATEFRTPNPQMLERITATLDWTGEVMTLRFEGIDLIVADHKVVFRHTVLNEVRNLTIPFTSNNFTFKINITEQVFFTVGTTYQITKVTNSQVDVRFRQTTFDFVLQSPPTVTSFEVRPESDPTHFVLVLIGIELPVGTPWTATLTTGFPITGSFSSSTKGESDPLPFRVDGVYYDRTYTVANVSLENGTIIRLKADKFHTPQGRREGTIEELYATLSPDGQKGRIRIRGTGLEPGPIRFSLENNQSLYHSTVRVSEGVFQVELPLGTGSGELKCGEEYTIHELEIDSCDVSWNTPQSFTVPHPPKVVFVIAESNTVGTGVKIDLMGDDLRMDEDYIVTLLPSGSFVVHFNNSSRASVELSLDGEEVDFNTTYTIDSIAHVDNPDHKMEVSSGASFTTTPKPDLILLAVSSVRGEESKLCGEENRPCKSVDWAWGIVEPLSIDTVSIAILDDSDLTTPIEQTTGSLHIFSAQPNGLNTLVIPSTASLGDRDAMIVIHNSFEMSQTNVLIEVSSPKFSFLSAVNAFINIKQGSIVGTSSSSTMNEEDTTKMCGWESGVIHLLNSSTFITDMSFKHLSLGVFAIRGGDVVIDTSSFSSNSPHFASFPSYSRNIECSDDGSVDVQSLSGGDGTEESISSWIVSSDCTLSSPIIKLDSPFFIPKPQPDLSTCTFDKEKDTYHVEIHGSTLIPCGLFLELAGDNDSAEPTSTKIELLPSIATSFNETFISLDITSSVVMSVSSSKEVRGRLVFGNAVATEDLFTFPQRRISSGLETWMWLIPVIVAVVVFLILVALIVICVMCRRMKKEGEKVEEEEESIQQQEEEEEKSDHTPSKHDDKSILDATHPALVLEPEETDQFDLKIDEPEQERPHSMKTVEAPKPDPSFDMMVDISRPTPEQDGHDQLLELDEKPKQKKKKKKRGVESLDDAVAPNSEEVMKEPDEEGETTQFDETVERPKRKGKKRDRQNEVAEEEMEPMEQNLEEEVSTKEKKKKRKRRIEEGEGMEPEPEQEEVGEKRKKKKKKIEGDEDAELKESEEPFFTDQEIPIELNTDQQEEKTKKKKRKGKKDTDEKEEEAANVEEENVVEQGVEEEERPQQEEGKKKRKKKNKADVQEVAETEDTPLLEGEPDTKPKKKKKKQLSFEQTTDDTIAIDAAI